MPYPNEHSARLKTPGAYKRFRRENDKFGKGIHAIWGVRKDNNKVELQAIRFDKTKFSATQARKWMKDHDYSPISFEPATGSSEAPQAGDAGRLIVGLKVETQRMTDEGVFEGYGSVFGNVDAYGEVVDPGAFAESLADHRANGTWPKMLWQHQRTQPIGVWAEIEETDYGLRVKGRLALDQDERNEVRQAREAYTLMKIGALDGLSIGYRVVDSASVVEDGKNVVHLKKLRLMEVSPVTFPANEAARVGTVKSVRDIETILRDAGLSREVAKVIASAGHKALVQRDADPEPEVVAEGTAYDEVAERLASVLNAIKGKE